MENKNTDSGVMVINNTGGICSVDTRPLEYRPKKVLELINNCIANKIILDDFAVQEWWVESFIKGTNWTRRKWLGGNNWQTISEYDHLKSRIKEDGGLMKGGELNKPKGLIKYHIGNLVMKGYLTVLPIIKISDFKQTITNDKV